MPYREIRTPWYWIGQIMRYKNYECKIDYDEVDKIFRGYVQHISDRVTFTAATAEETESAFHKAIDDYLDRCQSEGIEPNPPVAKVLAFSQLPAVIDKVQGRIKHIPQGPEYIPILETIQLMLEIINSYAFWVGELKKEMNKLMDLNKAQAEALRARGIIHQ